ncbi:MAG: hypothetical protein A2X61_15420 [Ignavibacteria bacterium GWB2_35_12]|nr:MAG: hypothetical protein A2X61_15420 [Ignavibacteria bacterium GWB2_35_12]OGU88538.1 MAG: hypothetical protein A2220_06365 [Ignavibacteria bacterium RIFOXYA2_FULL_35_10]OGV20288.1 MAG: hypothetical protein A2475_12385 [Ignavibacteria bacterium RIFOXYC2_FULL_35_21]
MTTVKAIYDKGKIILLEQPKDVKYSKAIVTLIDEVNDFDAYEAMRLSEKSFDEWDNKEDAIYDTL